MKKILLLAGLLLLVRSLHAQAIIVYAKGDISVLDAATPKPADAAKAAFLAAFQADLAKPRAFAAPFALIAPPEWGRTVAGAHGEIQFHESFPAGFVVKVALDGLLPSHRYILTLNGNPKLEGNERLYDLVPGMSTERYVDFLTATTDAQGHYQATFAIALPAGPYGVRFYVKDTVDFKIVLYHDYFKFQVE